MNSRRSVYQRIAVALGTFGALVALAAGQAGAAKDAPKTVKDELLVQFKAGVARDRAHADVKNEGAAPADEIQQLRVKRIKVNPANIDKVKARLAKNPRVTYVEHNHLAERSSTPNDPSYGSQWHFPKIAAPQGWDISTGSSTVDIAIIDSGVDPYHPDLSGKLLPGWNFLNGTSDTHDVRGHGTAVAGCAAAKTNNGAGVAGVSWNSMIMPLVVLDANDYASYYNIAQAITYAVDHGVKVINISIGGSSSSSTLQNAVNYAWSKGALIFASAMNTGTSTPYYPAACTNVVAVAATTSADARAGFSNYGSWITLSAPGEAIYTTNNGGYYGTWSGTSFASPITAGLAALVWSVNPTLSNAQVIDLMKKNADDLGTTGFDQDFGHGRINVYKSLSAAKNAIAVADTTAPAVAITSPTGGATVKGTASVSVSASDNAGVTKVELMVDGKLFAADTTAPFSFSWDSATVADGSHTLSATAYDAAGNVGRSGEATVSVMNAQTPTNTTVPTVTTTTDTSAPDTKFTSPSNGVTVYNKATLSINAADNVGVTKIYLFIDGQLEATAIGTSSLTFTWNCRKATAGAHVITTKAYDAAGNVGTASITIYTY